MQQRMYLHEQVRSDEAERVQVDLLYRRQPQQRPARGYSHHPAARRSGPDWPAHFDVVPFAFVAKKNALGDLCIDGMI